MKPSSSPRSPFPTTCFHSKCRHTHPANPPSPTQHINRTNQDIGARRLNTVVHRVLEDISFTAPRRRGEAITIDAAFVKERLKSFDPVKENALTKYIL